MWNPSGASNYLHNFFYKAVAPMGADCVGLGM